MNELSAMLLGWLSGFLLGLWSFPKLVKLCEMLEERLLERERGKAEKEA